MLARKHVPGLLILVAVVPLMPGPAAAAGPSKTHIQALIRRMATDTGQAQEALWKIGRPAVPQLIAALKDRSPAVRARSIEVLGYIRDARAAGPLLKLMPSGDRETRFRVVEALGLIGSKRATRPLTIALTSSDASLRERAAEALGGLKDPRAIGPLMTALRDSDDGVRTTSAISLGELKAGKAVDPLVVLVRHDKDSYMRKCAAVALGNIGSRKAVLPLIKATRDTHPDVRIGAYTALGQIGDPRAVDALIRGLGDREGDMEWEPRDSAAESLARIQGPKADKVLTDALKARKLWVLLAAHRFYIGRGFAGSEPTLIAALNDGGGDGYNMAQCFVKSGNLKLEAAGRKWLAKHRIQVSSASAVPFPKWRSEPK